MADTSEAIFDPSFVRNLFDEMSATYGLTNYLSSLGFCQRWRERCVALAGIEPGMVVYDLMTGMGECWHLISRDLRGEGSLTGLDFSPAMCRQAEEKVSRHPEIDPRVLQEDVLENSIPSGSADRVVSAFGLKTFSEDELEVLAGEIRRILRPGGRFALLEISVPEAAWIRVPYMAYLEVCVPLIGWMMLGNPDNYRMLGVYTEHFKSCAGFAETLRRQGLTVEEARHFFGCATSVSGTRET